MKQNAVTRVLTRRATTITTIQCPCYKQPRDNKHTSAITLLSPQSMTVHYDGLASSPASPFVRHHVPLTMACGTSLPIAKFYYRKTFANSIKCNVRLNKSQEGQCVSVVYLRQKCQEASCIPALPAPSSTSQHPQLLFVSDV